jgi:hypothetical protein
MSERYCKLLINNSVDEVSEACYYEVRYGSSDVTAKAS